MFNLSCFLSGGHSYEDKNLFVEDIPTQRQFKISNFCSKCGKPYTTFISYDDITPFKPNFLDYDE